MKNRKIIIVVALIVIIGLVAVILPKTNSKSDATPSNNKEVKIGILQFVTHPALDAITKGAKDELKKRRLRECKD